MARRSLKNMALGYLMELDDDAGAISAVAIAIGEYATEASGVSTKVIAVMAILSVSFVHWFGVKTGGRVQTFLTGLKLSLILFFCIAPFFIHSVPKTDIHFLPQPGDWNLILSSGFAVSLVFVVYAYTGWDGMHRPTSLATWITQEKVYQSR